MTLTSTKSLQRRGVSVSSLIGWILFVFILGVLVGIIIWFSIKRLTRNRRSRRAFEGDLEAAPPLGREHSFSVLSPRVAAPALEMHLPQPPPPVATTSGRRRKFLRRYVEEYEMVGVRSSSTRTRNWVEAQGRESYETVGAGEVEGEGIGEEEAAGDEERVKAALNTDAEAS